MTQTSKTATAPTLKTAAAPTFTQRMAPAPKLPMTPGAAEMLKTPVYRNGFYAALMSRKGGKAVK